MISLNSLSLLIFYILYLKNTYCADTQECIAADDCKGGTKCLSFKKLSYCVQPCTTKDEEKQCGGKGLCKEKTDIEGRNVFTCAVDKECSMDLECAKKSPKSTCNIFTLKCNNVVDDKKSTTTAGKTGTDGKDITKGIGTETTSISRKITRRRITTKNSCVDLIPDGPNGCSSLKKYCNDENYKQFLNEMCPKTCGKCFPIGKTTHFPTKIPIGVIETCKDSGPDCEKDIALCSSKVYKDLMKRICRKSCNYC